MFLPIGNNTTRYRTPWVTYGLITLNVLVFLRMYFQDEFQQLMVLFEYASLAEHWSPVRAVTSGFLHGGFLHLLGNMWFLFLFGSSVEGKLGHLQMGAAYLAGLQVSDLTQHFLAPGDFVFCIGASGAVGAIVGAYWFLFSRSEVQFFYWIFTFWVGTFWTKVHWSVLYLFGWDALMWFLQKKYGVESGIAHGAHLGGLACGFLIGLLLRQFSYVTLDGDDMVTRFTVWKLRRRALASPPADRRFGALPPDANSPAPQPPLHKPKAPEGPSVLPLD